MTVQSFILLYNETFRHIRDHYGEEALRGLWERLSAEWCCHLDELVTKKGLAGMQEYWGGDSGTLSREKAVYTTSLQDGVFTLTMMDCPSVGEIVAQGRKPKSRGLTYCDHCPALYVPIAEKNGFEMDYQVGYNADGTCSGRCHLVARRSPQ